MTRREFLHTGFRTLVAGILAPVAGKAIPEAPAFAQFVGPYMTGECTAVEAELKAVSTVWEPGNPVENLPPPFP